MKHALTATLMCAALIAAACTTETTADYDIVITGGSIIDGAGGTRRTADIGITGDTISKIGTIQPERGKRVIRADGMIVSPGFIDIHTHTDAILDDPSAHNYTLQGITTVVDGNCGGSPLDLAAHFSNVAKAGIAINYASLIGQNSIRSKVMGGDDRAPTPEEMEAMKELVAEGMKAGAVGMSNGLKYRPAVFAKTDEVIELARVAARYGGFYATHIRSEGAEVIESVREAIEVGEKAGIPVEISHLKVLSVERWGDSAEMLRLIDDARARGVDVTADQYPYTASSTGLTVLFPAWALEGDWKKKAADPTLRPKIASGIVDALVTERAGDDMNRVRIAKYSADTSLEGKGLADILRERGLEPTAANAAELVIDLSLAGSASAIYNAISEDDILRIMRHPQVMIGSDGHITEKDVAVPHPRCYGTFPRVLGRYAREQGVLTLEEAVRKMTSLPAKRIGIPDRGTLAEGMRADIVVFDPTTIGDMATFDAPHTYSAGIGWVIVNGAVTAENGTMTDARAGKVIYGPGKE